MDGANASSNANYNFNKYKVNANSHAKANSSVYADAKGVINANTFIQANVNAINI